MIKALCLLAAICLLQLNILNAQEKESLQLMARNTDVAHSTIQVKKGYYSIYENSKKLKKAALHIKVTDVNPTAIRTVGKGFFAITGNHQKLPQTVHVVTVKPLAKATKGYYSIQPTGKQAE